ncbi:hypothetical protein VYU27_000234 [Nannochloropsis oceanica]
MGRSQLQYNRRARGRGRAGGRGPAGGPSGRGGGGGGRVASAKASQKAALRQLPSNQDRFRQGDGGGSLGGEGRLLSDSEGGDDLRVYAWGTDSQFGHHHVLAEEAADEEAPADLPSLGLDVRALAEGLICLPAHVRLGGVDPALTEGLMFRQGYPPPNEGQTPAPPPKLLAELVGSLTSANTDKHFVTDTTISTAPPLPSLEPPLEALLGLELSSSTIEEEKKTGGAVKAAATPSSSSSALLTSDLDDLLNISLKSRKSVGDGISGGDGKKAPSNEEEVDGPISSAAFSSKAKKLSALDAGDY